MRTVYKILKLLVDWHLQSLNSVEKRFINQMWEACQGIGNEPDDELLKEQCGLTDKQIKFVRDIAKNYLIK